MKLWTLMENTACAEGFAWEHGLSLYLEVNGKRILFDAGQSGRFAENAKAMGVDLGSVDLTILSHGHYDHGGGLGKFLELNKTAPVYVSPHAFESHENAPGTDIGLDPALRQSERIRFTADVFPLGEGLTLYSCNDRPRPFGTDTAGLTAAGMPEDFRHEQYLLIEEKDRRILISGCSHKGVLNLAHWFQPDVLVGGFHFMKQEPDSPYLIEAARQLRTYGTRYYTCHCTGLAQYKVMKAVLGDRLSYLSAGSAVEL